jgi:hypothetical protein
MELSHFAQLETTMVWVYASFVGAAFLAELVIYIIGATRGRNTIMEQLSHVLNVAMSIYDEIRHPREKVNRLCGLVVGLSFLWVAAMLIITLIGAVLVPFDFSGMLPRYLTAFATALAIPIVPIFTKKINDWLIP